MDAGWLLCAGTRKLAEACTWCMYVARSLAPPAAAWRVLDPHAPAREAQPILVAWGPTPCYWHGILHTYSCRNS